MGGRSGPTPSSSSSRSGSSGVSGGGNECPVSIRTSIAGPTDEIVEGSWLLVQLDATTDPHRVVLIDEVSAKIVGALAGVPNLPLLIRCLDEGVSYRAYVEAVDGGRVDVTLARQ